MLNTNQGIFFEFVPMSEFFNPYPKRLSLEEVSLGVNYAIILNTNAGLFGYVIGDTVKFVSLQPYRIIVTGRIKHFISAFGEHVIAEEVEKALLQVCQEQGCSVVEFTVAPQITPTEGLPYHEWFIEFNTPPKNMGSFTSSLDTLMRKLNIYYNDLITGSILRPLLVRTMQPDAFRNYMKSEGKLGGQNKVPRLSNDRKIADKLNEWIVTS